MSGKNHIEHKRWKLKQPNWYLKKRRIDLNPMAIKEKGLHINNGYYYNKRRLADVLGISYQTLYKWLLRGSIPAGQFIVENNVRYNREWYKLEEVYVMACYFHEYFETNHMYAEHCADFPAMKERLFTALNEIYRQREERGLEFYQPDLDKLEKSYTPKSEKKENQKSK